MPILEIPKQTEFCVSCSVCGETIETSLSSEYLSSKYGHSPLCSNCKNAILWARKQMYSDKRIIVVDKED